MDEQGPPAVVANAPAIARICHEANRGWCNANGDYSQPTWDDAPDWQRSSAINGVTAILDGTVTRPEESHEGWLAEKVAAGWVYGDVKDPEAKTHPCIVPYAELPAHQRQKDAIFFAVVRSFMH